MVGGVATAVGGDQGPAGAIERPPGEVKADGGVAEIDPPHLCDLPGPKMRIGELAEEPIELVPGDPFTLTTEEIVGDNKRVSMSFPGLPKAVNPGDTLFLSDGLIQLEVVKVESGDVQCRVLVGGELRSRKGLNLPDIDLGISAFTARDHECLKFAMEQGLDAVSQSFVESAADIEAVRNAAKALGHNPLSSPNLSAQGRAITWTTS